MQLDDLTSVPDGAILQMSELEKRELSAAIGIVAHTDLFGDEQGASASIGLKRRRIANRKKVHG